MAVEPGVVDANILAYAINADTPQHAVSRALLDAARDPAVKLYVTSQILCEFYSLITNPKRVVTATTPANAVEMIAALLAWPGLRVLPAPASVVSRLVELLKQRPVKGGDVFDLQIVATMQANNIQRIYTFNTADFQVFPELTVVAP
jgi:predicted nucleic acid-binding protein